MKKVLALVLAGVMALSLATVASAAALDKVASGNAKFDESGKFEYGDDAVEFYVENTGADADGTAYADAVEINELANEALDALADVTGTYPAGSDETTAEAVFTVNAAQGKAFADAVIALNAKKAVTATLAATYANPAGGATTASGLKLFEAAKDTAKSAIKAVIKSDDELADLRLDANKAGEFTMADPTDDKAPAFAIKKIGDTKHELDVSISSEGDVDASYKLIKNDDRDGAAILVKIKPLSEKFTVDEEKDYKVKIKVVQKNGSDTVSGTLEVTGTTANSRTYGKDLDTKANGDYYVDAPGRVIDVDAFDKAEGKAFSVNYDKYSVKFKKVSKQNTSLYLHAKTDVVDVDNTKAIGSVGFAATRVKDAATITMPISADNENYYGETVYVYLVKDGKPTGDAIAAEVVNHSSIVFDVPAGTTLGTYAAYGAKEEGDAEKPAIPETGANDLVNLAIVFSVVALAAAGFVAVKKASK